MANLNCWEFKKCGREERGANASALGVCSAARETRVNALNGGRNGGRACWAISGTLCGGKVQGSFASKIGNCMACEFYLLVQKEQGAGVKSAREIIAKLS